MNYRHAYHAGNFADVLKHAALALAIGHLQAKPKAFRVIDTHAGIGRYDLLGVEARKTGEWQAGIGRLLAAEPVPAEVDVLLRPYLEAVWALNPDGRLAAYPGSPEIARLLLRPQDHLVANELHLEDNARLRRNLGRDHRVTVMGIDGWSALKATLPPPERRGLVLVDPPFEQAGEFDRLERALSEGVRRFATGIFMLWLPIKSVRVVDRFYRSIAALGLEKTLLIELMIRKPDDPDSLNGTGLVVLNPPFQFDREMRTVAEFLATRLAIGEGASARVEWLVPERSAG